MKQSHKKSYSLPYLTKFVKVKVDRPLDSRHPKHGFKYGLNYGFIPNTKAPDGEEVDAYVLGVDKPLTEYEGKCIAVIHRLDDDDDKLIIAPKGMNFTNEEIRKATNFQEQYFKSEIIRK